MRKYFPGLWIAPNNPRRQEQAEEIARGLEADAFACGCYLETVVSMTVAGGAHFAITKIQPCAVHFHDRAAGKAAANAFESHVNDVFQDVFGQDR